MWKMTRPRIEWKCPSCGHDDFDYNDESNVYEDGLLYIYYTCRSCSRAIAAKFILVKLWNDEEEGE